MIGNAEYHEEGNMRRLAFATICLTLGWFAIQVSADCANAQEQKVTRIRMTVGELRAHGLAASPRAQPFPNSCQSSGNTKLSVSDDLLANFKSKGFTLESVCLAFSSHMRFDPETGQQLPLAFIPEIPANGFDNEFPLNVPLCYRNGVSTLDCDAKFDTWWGSRLDRRDLAENRQFAQRTDTMLRSFIQDNRLSGVFWRFEMDQSRFPKGFFLGSVYEWILASRALPRGYGYALHGPEGDDPGEEDVNLSTYRKKGGASSLWSD
jgi:hypothetical protein